MPINASQCQINPAESEFSILSLQHTYSAACLEYRAIKEQAIQGPDLSTGFSWFECNKAKKLQLE